MIAMSEGFCGRCHDHTGCPVTLTIGQTSGIIGWLNRDQLSIRNLAGLLRITASTLDVNDAWREVIEREFPGGLR